MRFRTGVGLMVCVASLVFAGACKPRQSASNLARVTVKDASGQDVAIGDAARIVSANTALTETIIAL
ncbi:MAG: hypothetical protein ABIP75_02265, partial [Pyrinomonadaceae bacterium]